MSAAFRSPFFRIPLALFGSALLLLVVLGGWANPFPGRTAIPEFPIAFDRLGFSLGGGRIEERRIVVERYQDGRAWFSSNWMPIEAARYPYLRISLDGLKPGIVLSFFWRTTDDPDRVNSIRLSRLFSDSSWLLNLSHHKLWRQVVLEFGFQVKDPQERPLEIADLRFVHESRAGGITAIFGQWGYQEPWSMRSAHYLLGAMWKEEAILTPLLFAWVGFGCAFYLLFSRMARLPVSTAHLGVILLLGWLVLDGRWLLNHLRTTEETRLTFAGKSADAAAEAGLKGDIYRLARAIKGKIGDEPETRVFIVADNDKVEYWRYRLQYHLAPLNIFNHHKYPSRDYPEKGDYLILVGNTRGLGYDESRGAIVWDHARESILAEPLTGNRIGVLFRIVSEDKEIDRGGM